MLPEEFEFLDKRKIAEILCLVHTTCSINFVSVEQQEKVKES